MLGFVLPHTTTFHIFLRMFSLEVFVLLRVDLFYSLLLTHTPLLFGLAPIQQPATFAQARNIINADGSGLRGLNKGLKSTLRRHGVFNMIYFEFHLNVMDAIPARQVTGEGSSLYVYVMCLLVREYTQQILHQFELIQIPDFHLQSLVSLHPGWFYFVFTPSRP
jgi:hypothetical protein